MSFAFKHNWLTMIVLATVSLFLLACSSSSSSGDTETVPEVTPVIAEVSPTFLYRGEDTQITLTGDDFEPGAEVSIRDPEETWRELSFPVWVATTELTAVVAADETMPAGFYDIRVTNPSEGTATEPELLFVSDEPVPQIDSISPDAIQASTDVEVTLTGSNFPEGFSVVAIDADGTEIEGTDPQFISGNEVSAWFNIEQDGPYIVRLLAPENEQGVTLHTDFSNLVVFQESGNTDEFTLSALHMKEPRMQHEVVSARGALGNRFLYVLGGRNDTEAEPLASVEVAQVDRFGELVDLQLLPERQGSMKEARHSFASFNHGEFIYAAGGVSDNSGWAGLPETLTNSIERARVLDPTERPELSDLQQESNGSLESGFWSYRVAAVRPDDFESNPGGETLAAPPAGILLGTTGGVSLTWTPAEGDVEAYRIYRTPEAGTPTGNEVLVTTETAASLCGTQTCSYQDTGDEPMDDRPLPQGALGVWHETDTLAAPRSNVPTAIAAAGDNRFVYLTGGEDADGVRCDYAYAELLDDGEVDEFVDETLYEDNDETTERCTTGPGLAVATADNTPLTGTDEWLMIGTGDENAEGNQTTKITRARVLAGGSLTDFCTNAQGEQLICNDLGMVGPQAPREREAPQYVLVGDWLLEIGGLAGTEPTEANRRYPLDASLNIGNSGENPELFLPRAFFAHTRFNGINYFFGGVTDTSGDPPFEATDTIERVIR